MEKIAIEVGLPKMRVIEFQKGEINIDPYISLSSRNSLISNYLEIIFDESKSWINRYLLAKHTLIVGVIDLNTSVDVTSLNIDSILGSGLWKRVKPEIDNFSEVEDEIFAVVKYALEDKYQSKSIGFSFDRISVKIEELLERISEVDLSKEGISELFKTIDVEKNKINEIVNPSAVIPTTEKPKRKSKSQIL